MAVTFKIQEVRPSSVEETSVLAHGRGRCTVRLLPIAVYPRSPRGGLMRALRQGRQEAGEKHLSLGDAARLFGLTAAEVSGLERGKYTFVKEDDWEAAFKLLRDERQAGHGR